MTIRRDRDQRPRRDEHREPMRGGRSLGPRGTGKTIWVRHTFPGAIYIDLLESELFTRLMANPLRAEASEYSLRR
jgi:hypothetical protein